MTSDNKRIVSHSIDEDVFIAFTRRCERKGYNKSAILQILINNWLKEKKS